MIQLSLFKKKTAEQALELASWLRVEMGDMRNQVKVLQAALKKQENTMNKLEGMIADLKQKELFED
ncbi:MAG: hypothetical protein LBF74_06105 [Treponema sp.]|jgi:DNA polymerase III delta prime subunit|nr:hypothetical protein [Treponema sp.]